MLSDGKLNEFVRHIQRNKMTQILGYFSLKLQFFKFHRLILKQVVQTCLLLFFKKGGVIHIIPLVISKGRLKKL